MSDIDITSFITKLAGDSTQFNTSEYDCYVRDGFGIFIPIFDDKEKQTEKHKHPAYEIIINFDMNSDKPRHYWAAITSPNVWHEKKKSMH